MIARLLVTLLLLSLPYGNPFSSTSLYATSPPTTSQQLGSFIPIGRRLQSPRPLVEHYDLTILKNVVQVVGQSSARPYDDMTNPPLIPYNSGTAFQETLVRRSLLSPQRNSIITLCHSPVYTMGSGPEKESNILVQQQRRSSSYSQQQQRPPTTAAASIPIITTRRGGEITYHGPGQLVLYPILNLNTIDGSSQYKKDLHWYLRGVEEVIIRGVRRAATNLNQGVDDDFQDLIRMPGITGVFLPPPSTSLSSESSPPPPLLKVSSLGISSRHWITLHGASLNILPQSLSGYSGIKACGLEDVEAGCLLDWFVECGIIKHPLSGGDDAIEARVFEAVKLGIVDAFAEVFECEIINPQNGSIFQFNDEEGTGEWV
jgi:lipoyl(octanoyl) transferase